MKKNSEKRNSAAQKRLKAKDQRRLDQVTSLRESRPRDLRRSGHVATTWRQTAGRRLGPYFQLRYRQDGKEKKIYLGRNEDLAQIVRDLLRQLQQPRRDALEYRRRWKEQRAQLRALRAEVAREIAPLGLRLQGGEFRGWHRLRRAMQAATH